MGKRPVRRAVFLDRDGVLNKVVMREGAPCSPRSLDEFRLEEGAAEAVARLKTHGFLTVVATNQPDLARGYLSQEAHEAILAKLRADVGVDDVFVCPDDSEVDSSHKKPNPGMLLEAAKKHDILVENSYMIGDTWKDMEAASRAGCRGILIDRPYNRDAKAFRRVASLRAAVDFILGFQEV